MRSPPVRLRMAVAALSLVGLFVSVYLLLNDLGLTGLAACSPGGGCDIVQSSPYSSFLGVPVALLGVLGYLVLFGVAFLGTQPRGVEAPWVGPSLLALATVALAFSAYFTALEAWVIRAWCPYCVVSAVLATLIFVLSLAELPPMRGGSPDESDVHG